MARNGRKGGQGKSPGDENGNIRQHTLNRRAKRKAAAVAREREISIVRRGVYDHDLRHRSR